MTKGFFRRTWNRYSKLGKGRKKKKIWRRPTGRDNKMRERRKGYPARVSIGYGSDRKLRGKINDKFLVLVNNIREMEKVDENQLVVLGKVGRKKRDELIKVAESKNIQIHNLKRKEEIGK